MKRQFTMFTALVIFAAGTAIAQESEEPLLDQLVSSFKTKPLSLGVLLQTVADFQPERTAAGSNGFSIANLRLNIRGELDGNFGYFLQTSFTRSPAVLDAMMYIRVTPALAVDAGLFKSPFSKEFLTSAASIDFVNRSQVVASLRPGRQIGVQARGDVSDGVVSYRIGLFNGNPASVNGNDNNDFLYAGRVAVFPLAATSSGTGQTLELGANAAYSKDRSVNLLGTEFAGKRLLLGGDIRLTAGDVLLAGEAIYARLEPVVGRISKPFGYHATAGYMIATKSQLLLRWDTFKPDGLSAERDLLIAGYNFWPTTATELQVNYIVPTKDSAFKYHQLLVNAQVAF